MTERFAVGGSTYGARGSAFYKIMTIIGLLVLLMAGNAGYGIWQMSRIGGELKEVAEHDLPLTIIVTRITEHQLEQAVSLQRLLRHGEEMANNPNKRRLFEEAAARFEKFAAMTDAEFIEAEEMVARFQTEAGDLHQIEKFEKVEVSLKELDALHAEYGIHARKLIDQLRAGNVQQAMQWIADVEEEELKVSAGLEALLEEFSQAPAVAAAERLIVG